MIQNLVDLIWDNWRVIRAAPIVSGTLLVATAAASHGVSRWYYKKRIADLDARTQLISEKLAASDKTVVQLSVSSVNQREKAIVEMAERQYRLGIESLTKEKERELERLRLEADTAVAALRVTNETVSGELERTRSELEQRSGERDERIIGLTRQLEELNVLRAEAWRLGHAISRAAAHLRISAKSITHFGPSRSRISVQSDHSFRSKAITCFGPRRSRISLHADHRMSWATGSVSRSV